MVPKKCLFFHAFQMWLQGLVGKKLHLPELEVLDTREFLLEPNQGLGSSPGQVIFRIPNQKDLITSVEMMIML